MESFLVKHFEANLRLASKLGVDICDTHFNQLLDLRLENNSEMNKALKYEALEEIKAIGRQVPNVHVLVLQGRQYLKAISVDFSEEIWRLPPHVNMEDKILDLELGHNKIKAHIRYFPFWDWHIISFVQEEDYFAPISAAHQIIYLSTIGVLTAVFIALLFAFHRAITKPLNRLIIATQDVTEGKLLPVKPVRDNEIGKLIIFFNSMVDSLRLKTEEVDGLISRLKESEERYRSLVELFPESVFVHQDGIIKFINPSGANMFRVSHPEELIGKPVLDLIHPDFHEIENSRIAEVLNDRIRLNTRELKIVTINKQAIDVETTGTFIEYSGKPAVLSVIRDITERKQAEIEIRKSANFTASLLQAIPTPVFYKDKEGRYIGCNRAFTEIMGVTSDEIKGRMVQELWPSEHAEVYHQKDLELMQSPQHQVYEFKVRDKDGHTRPVLFAKNVFLDENGNVAGLLGAFLDITELKQAEVALRSSHERFLTVLDSIDATIYVADMETYEILFMNKYIKESFGSDLTGEICWAVFRNELKPCQHCTNEKLVDENGIPGEVYVWQGKNPITGKWYVNYDRAIEWIDGRIVRLQIATDITNLKELEEERERYQNQLSHVQKMEAIGTLAGGIAHDFNNLLMGIQGRSSLMSLDLETSHPCREHVNAIIEYTRSATDLTKQLLGVARGGKYEVKPTELNQIVSESSTMFGRTKKEIRIHKKLHHPSPVVMVDRIQIEQVLLNIYVNAWQAMAEGGELFLETAVVTLEEIFCRPYSAVPGTYAKIVATDTGIGMDESTCRRVFDPFFTTKKKGRGTGLGLASAYGIVKNHAGIITVRSKIGHGTTFNIYLPLTTKAVHKKNQNEAGMLKGSETILLVDDEVMIIEVGKAMLERMGYNVILANSGEEALELISDMGKEIDLVILDLIMPGMNGGETFDLIREGNPEIPVILSSGYSISGQATEIMSRGCNGFIQKPFDISELSQKIRDVLDEPEVFNKI